MESEVNKATQIASLNQFIHQQEAEKKKKEEAGKAEGNGKSQSLHNAKLTEMAHLRGKPAEEGNINASNQASEIRPFKEDRGVSDWNLEKAEPHQGQQDGKSCCNPSTIQQLTKEALSNHLYSLVSKGPLDPWSDTELRNMLKGVSQDPKDATKPFDLSHQLEAGSAMTGKEGMLKKTNLP